MFEYNTQMKRMVLPEYGRNVQRMVDYCLTIKDRDERTRCAYAIVATMGNLFPHLRDIDEFKHKLWDHLAIMSDFKLDIDYPCEIVKRENLRTRPEPVPYKLEPIKYRHYGKIVEEMLKKCCEYPEGPERDALISILANHMKKSLYTWNKDVIEDDKILKDLMEYTEGKIDISVADLKLRSARDYMPNKKGGMRKRNQ